MILLLRPRLKQYRPSTSKSFLNKILTFLSESTKLDDYSPELKYTGGSFFGIGKASDIWFTIKGSVSNIVQRSDKEFDWLRKNLTLLFPGNIVQSTIT